MATSAPETVEMMRARFEAFAEKVHGEHDLDFIDQHFAPDWAGHIDGEEMNREEYKEMQRILVEGFPDVEFTWEPVLVSGQLAAAHWVMTGTHLGRFLGVRPTGRSVRIRGTFIARYGEDGSVEETWQTIDHLTMLRQLGLAPDEFTLGGLARTLVNLVRYGR